MLKNRQGFDLTLDSEIERQRRYGGSFSLVLIDLDKFKELNDTRGHTEGDRALQIVGEVLRKSTRDSDTCARLGGDEFAVLLPHSTKTECEFVCRQLVSRIQAGMVAAHFEVTASIGTATFDRPAESLAAAIQLVDKAMYQAKAAGRNTAVAV